MIALLILQAATPAVPPPAANPPAEVVQVPAGRVDENAVRQAEDAFGSTIGRETIGIYSAGSVRGFSPIAASNARIDGLYFDLIAAPVTRIRRSSSIKVGLSAQGYLFPAPTGVVDYALRLPGAKALVSTTLSGNSWGGAAIEVDAEVPLAGDRLSLGLGGSLNFNQFANGSNSRQHVLGSVLRWQPATGTRIVGFYGRSYIDDDEIGPLLSNAGPYLPPRIERRRFFGAPWMDYSGYAETGGAIASIALAPGWTAQLGGFYSVTGAREDIFPFLDAVQPDGSARYIAFSDPPFRRAAISGEARVTYALAEGPRRHLFAASLRARSRRDRIGGSAFLDFGPVRLGDPLDFPEPSIAYGAQARDAVEQWTGGVAFIGR